MTEDAATEDGPSNAELRKLIEKTLVRFQNWRVEAERNPNPRMVHQLKNIVSIIDSLTAISDKRMQYSYKQLAQRMAVLVNEVARLNMRITGALARDDFIDEDEEREITASLMSLVQSAVALIGMVQEGFGRGRGLLSPEGLPTAMLTESKPE
ncbi:MAG TPA: hypothetical protein DIC34_21850 [Treponema sp.]|nr:MAG: hypothetical protein A2Y36_11885 [Treponema sp. GWA1_62_8]OHE68739.1 MAG: hypothetical protein A2001_13805 [Treponema sp. GWC1_61_84]HCM29145.1 hypothetical protein [Treponema sp.]